MITERDPNAQDPLFDVDILIKTFMRPRCLRRLVESLSQRYPNSPVNIADDSEPTEDERAYYEQLQQSGHRVHYLPHDVGISAGRNHLAKHTDRPFVLLLDDDFVFSLKTKIEWLREVLEADSSLGVAGGTLIERDQSERRYNYVLDVREDILHYLPPTSPPETIGGHRCQRADTVLNFAMFRREVFDECLWDAALKTQEHSDFFLRLARTRWNTVLVEGVEVDHVPEKEDAYLAYRNRSEAIDRFLDKWGFAARVYCDEGSSAPRPRDLVRAYVQAAERARRRGRRGEATKWCLKALHLRPTKTRVWKELGRAVTGA